MSLGHGATSGSLPDVIGTAGATSGAAAEVTGGGGAGGGGEIRVAGTPARLSGDAVSRRWPSGSGIARPSTPPPSSAATRCRASARRRALLCSIAEEWDEAHAHQRLPGKRARIAAGSGPGPSFELLDAVFGTDWNGEAASNGELLE